jgi:hypothetical protein
MIIINNYNMLDENVNKNILEFFNFNEFHKNKYYYTYIRLAEKICSENRAYDSCIHEMHHVLPSSFGGVYCIPYTFREHYIAHVLLLKFTSGKNRSKMSFALHTFFHFDEHRKLNISQQSKMYVMHKKYFIEACKYRIPWTKTEMFHFKNMNTNDEFIGTRREFINYTKLTSQEIYNLLSKNQLRHSKGWGVYIEELGIFSFEQPAQKRTKPDDKQCAHCGKLCSPSNYSRWHGGNCKSVDPIGHVERSAGIFPVGKIKHG